MGAKKRPFYRIVVADARSPRDGRFIEEVGYQNPMGAKDVKINEERAKHWIEVGAQPTDVVKTLFKKNGIIQQDQRGINKMRELLETIVKSLVEKPEEVVITENHGEYSVIIELRVSQDDMGKVIGKQGRIAKAIRTILKAASIRENKKVTLEIIG